MKLLRFIQLSVLGILLISCCRNKEEFWDNTQSCQRHFSRGVKSLGGKQGDSRMVRCRSDFEWPEDSCGYAVQPQVYEQEFVAIPEQRGCNDVAMADFVAPQPRETPGDPGSTIPGIEAFRDPSTIRGLANIFRNVNFEYNSNIVRGQDNLATIHSAAEYLRNNRNAYVFIEGHTDERGPEAYNLSLGSRRANAVRNMLIQEGVDPNRVFTISYGKERPLVYESHEEAWSQNRRAEFKVYLR